MLNKQTDFAAAYENGDVYKLISSSDRWIVTCMSKDDEIMTMVSDDDKNPPHTADLINIGLLYGALETFNKSLYTTVDASEVKR